MLAVNGSRMGAPGVVVVTFEIALRSGSADPVWVSSFTSLPTHAALRQEA